MTLNMSNMTKNEIESLRDLLSSPEKSNREIAIEIAISNKMNMDELVELCIDSFYREEVSGYLPRLRLGKEILVVKSTGNERGNYSTVIYRLGLYSKNKWDDYKTEEQYDIELPVYMKKFIELYLNNK